MLKNKRITLPLTGILILFLILTLTGASSRILSDAREIYTKIQLFGTIVQAIREDYVEEKDTGELIETAIQGMVSNLDPHTAYLNREYFEQWSQRYEGYSGIGVTFDIVENKITVLSIIEDGPSDKVGLLAGDRIIAINEESAIGMKRDEVPLKLMGPKGTVVGVTVERWGWPEPRNFLITRDEVHVESIPYAFMIQPTVGYIGIVRFSSTTGNELKKHLENLENQGMKRLILDLRSNGGGYMEAAVQVADKFLPGGKRIVYTKGRAQRSFREYFSTNRDDHPFYPIIVLINRVSASASEIVAGALQDWDRALIVGETSFGKALVQTPYRFNDGSALLMTTGRYYTPNGRLIQRPYGDRTLQDYYTQISNDSLRRVLENDPSRPIFRTQILRRKVMGGGGITPDMFFKTESDTVSTVMRRILTYPNRLLFTFSEQYAQTHPELKQDFNHFLRNFQANGNVLQSFMNHIKSQGFKITNQEFITNRKDIQFYLKQYIADQIWGDEARFKVHLLRDRHLLEALNHLSAAEDLLSQAYHLKTG